MNSPAASLLLSVFRTITILALGTSLGFGADKPSFKSPTAARAQARFQQSVTAASKRLVEELDRNLTYAMKSGALEEANQINTAKQQAAAGTAVTADFKRVSLISARDQYRDSLTAAKGQYFRDLEPALRETTKAGDLQQANAIDAVRKVLESDLADGKITGKVANGLVLSIGGNRTIWENKAIKLPPKKTPVTLNGVLLLSGKIRTIKLRTAQASGSERLKFIVDGKPCEFLLEGSQHRYIVVTPLPGSDKMRLRLGDSIAANEWMFGPLEWAINDGKWRTIPLNSMIAVD